jgi:hypothetical protein
MTAVWDHSRASGSTLLVALAFADYADDWGRCWPALARISAKARIDRRTTQRAVRELEQLGELQADRSRGRVASRYRLRLYGLLTTTPPPILGQRQDAAVAWEPTAASTTSNSGEMPPYPLRTFKPSVTPCTNNSGEMPPLPGERPAGAMTPLQQRETLRRIRRKLDRPEPEPVVGDPAEPF